MRLSRAVLNVLLLTSSLAVGCLPARPDADSALASKRLPDAAGPGAVRIDIAVIERPAGDRYLNRALWDLADEQIVDLERKPALDDNGFRVGLIGGLPPADLLALLTSGRSCSDPHRVQLRAGSASPIALGVEQPRCTFKLFQDGRAVSVTLDRASCMLEVIPTLAENGRITLQFTPLVKHGVPRREPRVVRDPSGEHRWDMEVQQSTENYANLGWEVTVSPEEYVVVGTRLDRDDTLGQTFFLDDDSASVPMQRLLVIRTGRVLPDKPAAETPTGAPMPLALQAGWRSARGMSPMETSTSNFP
jgi:hypothetical protein